MFDKKRLDVLEKSRSNFFTWRGQFTPELVDYILGETAKKNYRLLDPFSGSGTVLLEAGYMNLECSGIEINPSAYYMSTFYKFINYQIEERIEFINQLHEKVFFNINDFYYLPICNKDELDYRKSFINLLNYANMLISSKMSDELLILVVNLLFKLENLKNCKMGESINNSFNSIKTYLLNLPYSSKKIETYLRDARELSQFINTKINLVLTSPPYINVFNYHQNHRMIMELLGYKILNISEGEIGSNRKNRGNRLYTVVQYCLDIEIILNELMNVLKDNAKLIFIVGRESKVRGLSFYNGRIVQDLLESISGVKVLINQEREFSNKFGDRIVEEIIVAEKGKESKYCNSGRKIALKHLLYKLKKEKLIDEVKSDLKLCIDKIETIKSSPIQFVK